MNDTPPTDSRRSLIDELRAQVRPDTPLQVETDAQPTKPEDQPQDIPDQRKAERHSWVTELTITIEETRKEPRVLHVTSRDISRGGFSFVYRQFITPGTTVSVRVNRLPKRRILRGVVRSCVHVGGIHHRIGVHFMPET